jgi:hypothetical protein
MQRREINVKRVEFGVPLTDGFGVTHAELTRAIQVAANEYWQATGVAQGGPLPDDAVRLNQGDGELVVFFELEKRS